MGLGKLRHSGWAVIAPAVLLLQVPGCIPGQFAQDAVQAVIAGRIIDTFAFFLDQIFFRLGF